MEVSKLLRGTNVPCHKMDCRLQSLTAKRSNPMLKYSWCLAEVWEPCTSAKKMLTEQVYRMLVSMLDEEELFLLFFFWIR